MPWSIPKGEPNHGEDLEVAARRETLEETGVRAGQLFSLGYIDYVKSRKRVYCFYGEADACQPHCASWEVDKAEFVQIEQARKLIHIDQVPFLDRLSSLLV